MTRLFFIVSGIVSKPVVIHTQFFFYISLNERCMSREFMNEKPFVIYQSVYRTRRINSTRVNFIFHYCTRFHMTLMLFVF